MSQTRRRNSVRTGTASTSSAQLPVDGTQGGRADILFGAPRAGTCRRGIPSRSSRKISSILRRHNWSHLWARWRRHGIGRLPPPSPGDWERWPPGVAGRRSRRLLRLDLGSTSCTLSSSFCPGIGRPCIRTSCRPCKSGRDRTTCSPPRFRPQKARNAPPCTPSRASVSVREVLAAASGQERQRERRAV